MFFLNSCQWCFYIQNLLHLICYRCPSQCWYVCFKFNLIKRDWWTEMGCGHICHSTNRKVLGGSEDCCKCSCISYFIEIKMCSKSTVIQIQELYFLNIKGPNYQIIHTNITVLFLFFDNHDHQKFFADFLTWFSCIDIFD